MTTGTLHVVPVTLGGEDVAAVLPQSARKILSVLDYFIVENEKTRTAAQNARCLCCSHC
jgi:16S rRNA C1402 (ribose-2'-O) methylase RsmI